jgi:hypothetical protein
MLERRRDEGVEDSSFKPQLNTSSSSIKKEMSNKSH